MNKSNKTTGNHGGLKDEQEDPVVTRSDIGKRNRIEKLRQLGIAF